ncbi:hypothetical protein [Roseospira goensis]|uniref:Uncharacterized protein n=1 Tax=Roseospira goensis TaxID=391922 RepID=A0A7W6WKE1_9PROT|nr:hypothetical protein [Roseospira goensis]MBB4285347.1 hypothetical protein [Roseospira goensis]
MQGFVAGASEAGGAGKFLKGAFEDSDKIMGRRTNSLPFEPDPFCHGFDADPSAVSRVVESILPLLGNPIVVSDPVNGDFETDFKLRQHKAAQWVDRYIIRVIEREPKGSNVYVMRLLYISRDGKVFNQALSVGHNETWILTQIRDRLPL